MKPKEHIGPSANLEDIEQFQRQRAPEEDEGVNFDDELDEKRILNDLVVEGDADALPIDRMIERDRPEDRGNLPIDDEARGEKRRKQYEGGAELVSETD